MIDLKNLQLCKGLDYFKKTRHLETNFEKTFYDNFIREIDNSINHEDILNNSYDDLKSLSSLNDEGINNQFDYENISISQDSSIDGGISPRNDDILKLGNEHANNLSNHQNASTFLEGFSHLKSNEIKLYIHQFGDGNKEILNSLPNYKSFTKSLNQMDKWKLTNLDKSNFKDKCTRVKKIQSLFEFNIENEVIDFKEIFEKKETKKKIRENKKELLKKNKNTKKLYNYGPNL